MAEQRARIKRLRDHLYLIDDAGESTCYVVCGKERAMVIDTANGMEDLHAIVRSLTDLPLVVVNTHGHCDHIYGNVYFDEAWLHLDDLPIAQEHFGYEQQRMDEQGLKPCPLRPMEVGQVFDLGDLKMEVISLKGHTPGSIGLLDRKDRILFSGDGINTHLWMQLGHSLPIRALHDTLVQVQTRYAADFDWILTGHARDLQDARQAMGMLLTGCEELLCGQRENDQPYHYFGGECLQHPLKGNPGECIVYSTDKL